MIFVFQLQTMGWARNLLGLVLKNYVEKRFLWILDLSMDRPFLFSKEASNNKKNKNLSFNMQRFATEKYFFVLISAKLTMSQTWAQGPTDGTYRQNASGL